MARRNIFDILEENNDIEKEVERIQCLYEETDTIKQRAVTCTIYEFLNKGVFAGWKRKGHCLNLEDFTDTIDFYEMVNEAPYEQEQLLNFIETVYNFWWLAEDRMVRSDFQMEPLDSFYFLKKIMDDVLAQVNYKVYKIPEEECVLVGENKPEVTAVAEIIDHNLVLPVLRYNHFSLKGDLKTKKSILLQLGSDLEAKRKLLAPLNKQLESDIFYMLNNINLRHNNVNQADKSKYKEHIANMTQEELESWYDELYQMMLLAYLILDNEDRKNKIAQLKTEMGAN